MILGSGPLGWPEGGWGGMIQIPKRAQMGARVGNQAAWFLGCFSAKFFLQAITWIFKTLQTTKKKEKKKNI